jgi:hypothetical protein
MSQMLYFNRTRRRMRSNNVSQLQTCVLLVLFDIIRGLFKSWKIKIELKLNWIELKDDFLLRHYDSGPCKHKLGHSRASVIWHRTQVVGIFAGFGLLILLASPMFILAAPCLLCCKCNSWYKNDDHEDYDDFNTVTSDIVAKSDSIL